MPRRDDLKSILVIGSGPIVIGQGCEFDYSGTQACRVLRKERPDAVLPTLGGQTALNAAVQLHENGTLKKYGVELIGADIDAIEACEDREKFKEIVTGLGAEVPRSTICHSI